MDEIVQFDEGTSVLVKSGVCVALVAEVGDATEATQTLIGAAAAGDVALFLQSVRNHVRDGSVSDIAAIMATGEAHCHVAVAGSLWVSMQDPSGSVRVEANAGRLHEVTTSMPQLLGIQPAGAVPLDPDAGSDLLAGAVRAGRVLLRSTALSANPAPAPPASQPAADKPASKVSAAPVAAAPIAETPTAKPVSEVSPAPLPAAPIAETPTAKPVGTASQFGIEPGQQLVDFSEPVASRGPLPTDSEGPALPAASSSVMVLGVRCPADHHNHPDARYCASCGRRMGVNLTRQFVQGSRPPLGLLIADDGLSFSLVSDVIIGRDPDSHPSVVDESALGWRLPDESSELSRSHVRIQLQDWDVHVTDLGSSNGTSIRRRGSEVIERVSTEELIRLEAGDSLRLGRRELRLELHHVPPKPLDDA